MGLSIDAILAGVENNKSIGEVILEQGPQGPVTMEQFTDEQIQQFTIAESYGDFDTECKQHPEWSPTFMNYFINRKHEGRDLGIMYELADWARTFKMPDDVRTSKICTNDTALYFLTGIMDMHGRLPKEPPTREDGKFDWETFLYQVMTNYYTLKGAQKLLCGRLVIGDVDGLYQNYIFGEGNKAAREALDSLCDMSSQYSQRMKSDDPMTQMGENFMVRMNMVMALDDMNIRGRQILDAMEYADNSAQTLYDLIMGVAGRGGRSKEVVDYCNYKAAKRIADGVSNEEYIAVQSGASFDYIHKDPTFGMSMPGWRNDHEAAYRYLINHINYEDYLIEVKPIQVAWSTMDVTNGVDMDSFKKIVESRGFKLVRQFHAGKSWGKDTYYMLYYSPSTGDWITAGQATQDDVTYGGVNMVVYRKERLPFALCMNTSSGYLNTIEASYYEYTHHEGLFSVYDDVKQSATPNIINWDKLGFSFYELPVPCYKSIYLGRIDNLGVQIGYDLVHELNDMGSYHMQGLINHVCLANDRENFDFSVFPAYENYWKNDPYFYAMDTYGFNWPSDLQKGIKIVRLCFVWLEMPLEEVQKYDAALLKVCQKNDERDRLRNEDAHPRARMEWENQKHFIDIYNEMHNIILNGFENERFIVDQLSLGNPRELAAKLPWLQ